MHVQLICTLSVHTLSCLVGAPGHLDEPIGLTLARQMGNALGHAKAVSLALCGYALHVLETDSFFHRGSSDFLEMLS